jgi:hypothetical protein
MYRFNEQQMKDFIKHIAGIAMLLPQVKQDEPDEPIATGIRFSELRDALDALEGYPRDADFPPPPAEPKPFTIYDYDYDDCRKRIEVMSRLCGRWKPTGNRCEIEIERRGEHFILYYLKRNGTRTEDRYALLWSWGDVYYCCAVNRVVSLSLDIEADTLIVSPGVDYTRVVEPEK